MTLLYYDPRFLEHDTGQHPERADRLQQVARHLQRTKLETRCGRPKWEPVTDDELALVHDLDYARGVRELARIGGGRIEMDTVVSPASYDVARLAAGAVCDAVRRVIAGEDRHALCLVRPPGHHALRSEAMGFCLFNSIALGARLAVDRLDLDRVLIVDWDVHHGNGTQDIFYEDPRVGFFSIHRWPFYPGTGEANETGAGDGQGTTLNVPVEFGTSRERYHELFARNLEEIARRVRPQLVLISAGFDSHRDDPIGSLDLETEDFAELTQRVLEVAAEYSQGRIVSVLEGGYNPGILAGCVETHLRELLGRESAEAGDAT
jgi:acetoin utilization deacetylase AcuC-like enzyme